MDRRRVSVAMCQYNPHGIDATQKKEKDVDKKVMSKVKKKMDAMQTRQIERVVKFERD